MFVQEDLDILQSWEQFPRTRHLISNLDVEVVAHIDACSLRCLYMIEIRANQGLLTTLVEMWHNNYNTFRLPTDEMSVTLDDVYKILNILITGKLVQYDHDEMGGTESLQGVFEDEDIVDSKVQ